MDWLKAFSAEEGDRVISGDRITYDDIENVRISLMVMDPNALILLKTGGVSKTTRACTRDRLIPNEAIIAKLFLQSPKARTDISGRACGPSLVAGGRDEVEQEGLRSVLPIR